MLNGYNLAFMPTKNSNKFIQLAHNTAINITPGDYLLGSKSLPHVSICHFITEESHIEKIWNQVQELTLPSLFLIFTTLRSKVYQPDMYCDVEQCAVSLIPNHLDRLMAIHMKIANIVQKPLNAAFSNYDPHLTLFNCYDIESCKHFNQNPQLNSPIEDVFEIALCNIDRIGQVTKILGNVPEVFLDKI